jgi:predicted lipoprotein
MIERRPRRIAAIALSLGMALATAWSCGGGGGDTLHAGPRRTMLSDLANVVIVPTYTSLVAESQGLVAAAAQLEASPDAATLASVQSAWRRARAVWKQSQAFAIGPADTLRTAAKIDWTPIRSDRVEQAIAGSNALTAAYIESLGANLKGLLAIEYLIFDADGGASAALQALSADTRRRAFVRALAENIRDESTVLRDAWAPGAGDFAAELANAGAGSATFPTVKSAVDTVVNQVIFLSENVADEQLLAALGSRTGGVPRPEALAAHRSQNGLADLLDNLAGIQSVYFDAYAGRQGTSLNSIVMAVSPSTAGALAVAIRRAMETATSIPQPLEQSLSTDRALVENAQERAKDLMAKLEIDLISALGATLRFNPSDGD